MIRGKCVGCRNWTDDLSYPAGALCPTCRAPIEAERAWRREAARRRSEREWHQARRELAEFLRPDPIFLEAARRLDLDDPF